MRSFFSFWCECTFWCWVAFFMGFGIYAVAAKVISSEEVEGSSMRTMEIIEFHGHTYVHYRNHWSSAGDAFLHDPDCPCIKNAVQKILDKGK